MAGALAEVKRDLGRDAVILHTRCVRKGGLLGLIGGRHVWEVQASPNVNVAPRAPKGRYVPEPPAKTTEEQAESARAPAEDAARGAPAAPGARMAAQMREIHNMVRSLLIDRPQEKPALAPPVAKLRRDLLAQDVDEQIVSQLIGDLQRDRQSGDVTDATALEQRLTKLVAARIPVVGPDEAPESTAARIIALIGPTGVGKTTTIAKMAANMKLRSGRKVGLITMDTYRIAAVEQLRTYAEIIDVPIRAVLTPGELHQAVVAMQDMDAVLIDTAGRSQNDLARLNELGRFLAASRVDEVHLAISAAANPRVASATVERFAPLGANRIIMTKLDEADTFGVVLNVAAAAEAAVSFVTTGQDVPDDIAPADARLLAEAVVKGSWNAERRPGK